MNINLKIITAALILVLIIVLILLFLPDKGSVEKFTNVEKLPVIYPDYQNVIIPPNIAPLNFQIMEPGDEYFVKIHCDGQSFHIYSSDSKVAIPENKWKELLQQNRNKKILFDIYTKQKNKWNRYLSVENKIANEEIDGYLVYRLIPSVYNLWNELGIYQRNLQNFDEKLVLNNKLTKRSCINCHYFCNNDPDKMIIHSRASVNGMYLLYNNNISLVNTKTKFNNAAAYASWHPNEKLIAFSVNKVTMFYHSQKDPRDVMDIFSDLILYKVESNMVTSSPKISDPDRMETYPEWSHDGRYLYFCSSEKLDMSIPLDSVYNKIKYDLMRIEYDLDNDNWGEPELIISSKETDKSISHPKTSPDGRYLLFCMALYSNFPVYRKSSDLYLLDLGSGKYSYLDINSNNTESYHSWSANSRWFVFGSKRDDGVYTRPYFCYISKTGKVSKPFVLPQKDPGYYNTYFMNYNIPQLVKGPIKFSPRQFAETAFAKDKKVKARLDPRLKSNKEAGDEVLPWKMTSKE